MRKHLNAVALATMVGGLSLPEGVQEIDGERFPFSEEAYNPSLLAVMGVGGEEGRVRSLEPDIVGERLVLDALISSNPFDRDPEALFAAAEALAAASDEDAFNFASFRARTMEDFPQDAVRADLVREPRPHAPVHAEAAWLSFAIDSFEAAEAQGQTERFLSEVIREAASDPWIDGARQEISELRRQAEAWLAAHPNQGDFASH